MPQSETRPQANTSEDRTPRGQRRGIIGWCARHPKITILFTLLVLLCAFTGVLHVAAENRLENQIAAIRAKGEPTTVADLNRMCPTIPDEENMTLGLIKHGRAGRAVKLSDEMKRKLPVIGDAATKRLNGERMPPEQLEAARWYLGETAEALTGIHEALRLERGSLGIVFVSPVVNTEFPC